MIVQLREEATNLYEKHFNEISDASSITKACTVAPGRVNLIGEHVDYTGGFVFPIAIEYSTVVVGSLFVKDESGDGEARIVSTSSDSVVEFPLVQDVKPFEKSNSWANYVIGVVLEYLSDVMAAFGEGKKLYLQAAIAGNVPLGSGLSSSAALEVAFATLLEAFAEPIATKVGGNEKQRAIDRAVKCQHAENTFCHVPCGIMDQFVSSAGLSNSALLIDCESNDFVPVQLGGTFEDEKNAPIIVVTNSNVKHSHADGEYPVRVAQCKGATEALQKVNSSIKSLRYATFEDLKKAKGDMTDLIYRRAKHVISENERTLAAKEAFGKGDVIKFGELMNGSHESMKNDYEVSSRELLFSIYIFSKFSHGNL